MYAYVYMQDSLITALHGGTKYCDKSVCLSVCLSVRSHISTTTRPNFVAFSLHVNRSSSRVALRHLMYFRFCAWHVFTQCASCMRVKCVYSNQLAHNNLNFYVDSNKFCSTTNISKYMYTSWLAHWGRGQSLCSTVALFALSCLSYKDRSVLSA